VLAGAALAALFVCSAGAQKAPSPVSPPPAPVQDEATHAPLTKDQAKDLFRRVDAILSFVSQDRSCRFCTA
jgi:hypothetical protein